MTHDKAMHPNVKDQIIEKISAALEEFKAGLGEKKFKSRVKKAGKILSSGMKRNSSKKISLSLRKRKSNEAKHTNRSWSLTDYHFKKC